MRKIRNQSSRREVNAPYSICSWLSSRNCVLFAPSVRRESFLLEFSVDAVARCAAKDIPKTCPRHALSGCSEKRMLILCGGASLDKSLCFA